VTTLFKFPDKAKPHVYCSPSTALAYYKEEKSEEKEDLLTLHPGDKKIFMLWLDKHIDGQFVQNMKVWLQDCSGQVTVKASLTVCKGRK
jgi:hypothetical protein